MDEVGTPHYCEQRIPPEYADPNQRLVDRPIGHHGMYFTWQRLCDPA